MAQGAGDFNRRVHARSLQVRIAGHRSGRPGAGRAVVVDYVAEPGSDLVREAMAQAEPWFMCRVGFVETVRAVELAGGRTAAKSVTEEWPVLAVVESISDWSSTPRGSRSSTTCAASARCTRPPHSFCPERKSCSRSVVRRTLDLAPLRPHNGQMLVKSLRTSAAGCPAATGSAPSSRPATNEPTLRSGSTAARGLI
jgi:hypothetical protein